MKTCDKRGVQGGLPLQKRNKYCIFKQKEQKGGAGVSPCKNN